MRPKLTATSIRSRLSSDRRRIILEIDDADTGVSVSFTTEVMRRLLTSVAWLQETQSPPETTRSGCDVLLFPVRDECR